MPIQCPLDGRPNCVEESADHFCHQEVRHVARIFHAVTIQQRREFLLKARLIFGIHHSLPLRRECALNTVDACLQVAASFVCLQKVLARDAEPGMVDSVFPHPLDLFFL